MGSCLLLEWERACGRLPSFSFLFHERLASFLSCSHLLHCYILVFFSVPVRAIESSAFEQVKHFSQFTFVGIHAPALEDPWEGKPVIFTMLVHHLTHL